MIFEKCHGDFAQVYDEKKPFVEKIAKKIISELVDAVAYLHKFDIVHRDLKMENILLGDNPVDPKDEYYIKLTDFGLAVIKTGKGVEGMLHDFCGTLFYMAPEVITIRSYSHTCDMWSIGVILYMLVTGDYPFYSENEDELKNLICTQNLDMSNRNLSSEVKDLILLLLAKEPQNRLRATEALQHVWVLGKKLSQSPFCGGHQNILDKMKLWRAEMKVPTGANSDWVTNVNEAMGVQKSTSKQPMRLPKTNIHFDRSNSRKTSKVDQFPSERNNGKRDNTKPKGI